MLGLLAVAGAIAAGFMLAGQHDPPARRILLGVVIAAAFAGGQTLVTVVALWVGFSRCWSFG